MDSNAKILAKRPRVDIVPHTGFALGDAPQLVIGAHKYTYDKVTALYHARVLFDWLYNTAWREGGPSDAFRGDE